MKTLDFPDSITTILEKVWSEAQPVSIFIYGSRSRKDFNENSDYEVGVLFNRDKRWERSKLTKLHSNQDINIYPFILEDILKYEIDTPFPKATYLKEIIEESITVAGKNVFKNLESPEIKVSDLIELITFETAYALSAVLSARRNDLVTASTEFTKSILFAVKALVLLESGKFLLEYGEIYEESKNLNFLDDNAKQIINHANEVRGGKPINPDLLYKSIKFLNQVAYPRIKSQLKDHDRVILPGHPIYQ